MNKKIAFTLAEVLITLGIIGVVAAITMPTIIQKQNEKATITKLKKEYSVMSNALLNAISEYGDPEHWGTKSYTYKNDNGDDVENNFADIDVITKYLKIVEDCGHEAKGCFAHRYKRLDDSQERDFENLSYYRKFILADGTLVAIQGYGEPGNGEIWIDINGKNPPNIAGKDLFLFYLSNHKIGPYFQRKVSDNGYEASGWILAFDNMDYLHCNDKLSWEGKHSCK